MSVKGVWDKNQIWCYLGYKTNFSKIAVLCFGDFYINFFSNLESSLKYNWSHILKLENLKQMLKNNI